MCISISGTNLHLLDGFELVVAVVSGQRDRRLVHGSIGFDSRLLLLLLFLLLLLVTANLPVRMSFLVIIGLE
jgi:hypothetical protein